MAKPIIGAAAIKQIRDGLEANILRSASSFFGVPNTRIQQIAQIPASTASRLEKADTRLDPAASERIVRMARVARMAIDVFEDTEAAIAWMREPNHALGGQAPLDFMDTEPGAASVRLVLNAIATGGAA
jgi:putative toxin-antitoxin system antitoxin component (TIGR02293 family)